MRFCKRISIAHINENSQNSYSEFVNLKPNTVLRKNTLNRHQAIQQQKTTSHVEQADDVSSRTTREMWQREKNPRTELSLILYCHITALNHDL